MNDLELYDPTQFTLNEPCPTCGGTTFRPFGAFLRCAGCHAVLMRRETDANGLCLHCGKTNPPGAKFCGHCSAPMGQGRLVAMRFCPRCGSHQMTGYAFCVQCGYGIDLALKQPGDTPCPMCERAVPANETFCPHCGAGLQGQENPAGTGNPYKYCPACGAPLSSNSDLCPRCGTDASDYVRMVRALTHDRVAQVVAEEEAALTEPIPEWLRSSKAKRKRDDSSGIFANETFVGVAAILTIVLCLLLGTFLILALVR